MGAAYDTATPMVLAAASRSMERASFSMVPLMYLSVLVSMVATMLAMCITGPSLPKGSPEPRTDAKLTI